MIRDDYALIQVSNIIDGNKFEVKFNIFPVHLLIILKNTINMENTQFNFIERI